MSSAEHERNVHVVQAEPAVSTVEARFTENPLILSRKQSDSASSLRAPGGGSPTLLIKHISICEEPEQATASSRVGSAGPTIIEGSEGGVGNDTTEAGPGAGASFGAQDEGLGGPGAGAGGGTTGGGERAFSPGLQGRELGGPGGTAAGGPADGGGSVSGDSDLAQTAITELGGIVIGVGADPETPRTQSMVNTHFIEHRMMPLAWVLIAITLFLLNQIKCHAVESFAVCQRCQQRP